jgi:GxxExxY protein
MDKKSSNNPIPDHTEEIVKAGLDPAFQIHTTLGPGLLESVYEACMVHELQLRGINDKSQVALPVIYKGMQVDSGFRQDLLVDDYVVVEIKSAEDIRAVYKAQLLTYIRLSNKRLGLLININVVHLRDGIKRIIN